MATPQYLIEKRAKKFDKLLEQAHIIYPHRGCGDDSYSLSGLELIADKFKSHVRDMRQGDKRGRKRKSIS